VAFNNLGYMYEHGVGVSRDLSRATRFYCEAASSKMPEAEHNWAVIQATVKGLPTDCERAAKWIAKDARQSFGATSESVEAGSDPSASAGNTANTLLCAKR